MRRICVVVGLALLTAGGSAAAGVTPVGATSRSPIQHTIIVFQENISFDHYFGTYGHGVNGIPAGASQTHQPSGTVYTPFRLDGTTQNTTCDVEHHYTPMIKMVDHGAMDMYTQFANNKAETNPSTSSGSSCPSLDSTAAAGLPALSLGYYEGTSGVSSAPLQNYWSLAGQYTLADNFYQGVFGPSTPGAEWLVAATNNTVNDPNPNGDSCLDYPAGIPQVDIPNLGQEASAKGVSWAWFQGDFGNCGTPVVNGYSAHHDPFQYFTSTADLTHQYAMVPTFDSPDAHQHQRDLSLFYDALSGTAVGGTVPTLPSISWVKAPQPSDAHPGYSGPSQDDAFIGDLVSKVKASPYWSSTAIVVAFDETGGWWDHQAPPELKGPFAPWDNSTSPATPNLTGCQYPGDGKPCGEGGLGPRMPVLVISPFARQGYVDHDLLNTASLTQWVEWDYSLPALGVWGGRDRNAGSLRGAFDF